jgi:hypothetical protein
VYAWPCEVDAAPPPGPRRRIESRAVEESWEEDAPTRRQEEEPAGTLSGLLAGEADPPTLVASRHHPSLISCTERLIKTALCEVSGSDLRASCLQSARVWGDNCHVLRQRRPRTPGGRTDLTQEQAMSGSGSRKQKPHPTFNAWGGALHDLAFPDTREDDREGRWCLTAESTGALGASH